MAEIFQCVKTPALILCAGRVWHSRLAIGIDKFELWKELAPFGVHHRRQESFISQLFRRALARQFLGGHIPECRGVIVTCFLSEPEQLNSPLKKALLTGFHSTAKHNATKAVSPSSETMRTI